MRSDRRRAGRWDGLRCGRVGILTRVARPSELIIALDSENMRPTQLAGLDALVLSINMLGAHYESLQDALEEGTHTRAVEVMIHAWGVVDQAHRLSSLLHKVQGIKHSAPPVKSATQVLSPAEPLRNFAQHLGGELAHEKLAGRSVWGEIFWTYRDETGRPQVSLFISRTYRHESSWSFPAGPADPSPDGRPDHIQLHRYPETYNLTEAAKAVAALARALEREYPRALAEALANQTERPVLLRLKFPDD
jgi:hypothetical protein